MIDAFHPSFHELVPRTAEVAVVATGPEFLEGPVWLPEEGAPLVDDIPGDTCYRLGPDDALVVERAGTGKANGMTLDREGRVLVCEHATSVLARLERDGARTVLARTYGGTPLNSPNDVIVRADGSILFTDPPYGRGASHGLARPQELPFQGVFLHDGTPGAEPVLLDDALHRPNGLTLSLDGRLLYVADTERMEVHRFRVEPGGRLAGREVWTTLAPDDPDLGPPDGVKTDALGNVWVTGPHGVWALAPDATPLGRIRTPKVAASFTWGGADGLDLYIAAHDLLLRVRVAVPRAPLFAPVP